MRIFSWNVERLKAGADKIAGEIFSHEPDVIALQEYQPGGTGVQFLKSLEAGGYVFQIVNPFQRGFCSALLASSPMRPLGLPKGLPQQNWSSYWVEASCGVIGLSCIHVPVPRYREQLDAYWQALMGHCEGLRDHAHLIVGDFNTTRHHIDESGTTVPGDPWLRAMEELGWREAWRTCNSNLREYSWVSKAGRGFRVDQAWLSPRAANYLTDAQMHHAPREAGLSDHSALTVDLDIRNQPF